MKIMVNFKNKKYEVIGAVNYRGIKYYLVNDDDGWRFRNNRVAVNETKKFRDIGSNERCYFYAENECKIINSLELE